MEQYAVCLRQPAVYPSGRQCGLHVADGTYVWPGFRDSELCEQRMPCAFPYPHTEPEDYRRSICPCETGIDTRRTSYHRENRQEQDIPGTGKAAHQITAESPLPRPESTRHHRKEIE